MKSCFLAKFFAKILQRRHSCQPYAGGWKVPPSGVRLRHGAGAGRERDGQRHLGGGLRV